jgi:hypothetical protein
MYTLTGHFKVLTDTKLGAVQEKQTNNEVQVPKRKEYDIIHILYYLLPSRHTGTGTVVTKQIALSITTYTDS